jgi:heat shock protein HslJ
MKRETQPPRRHTRQKIATCAASAYLLTIAAVDIQLHPVLASQNPIVAMNESPLRNTYWKLVRLGGAPVEVANNQREPHLIFALDEMRVSGSGGCNRIAGTFAIEGDHLRFSPIAGTMMACPSGMEQEGRFIRALEKADRYLIEVSHLQLLDKTGAVLVEFQAVP